MILGPIWFEYFSLKFWIKLCYFWPDFIFKSASPRWRQRDESSGGHFNPGHYFKWLQGGIRVWTSCRRRQDVQSKPGLGMEEGWKERGMQRPSAWMKKYYITVSKPTWHSHKQTGREKCVIGTLLAQQAGSVACRQESRVRGHHLDEGSACLRLGCTDPSLISIARQQGEGKPKLACSGHSCGHSPWPWHWHTSINASGQTQHRIADADIMQY